MNNIVYAKYEPSLVMLQKCHFLWSDITCVQMQNQYAPNIHRILYGSAIKPTPTDASENDYFTNN